MPDCLHNDSKEDDRFPQDPDNNFLPCRPALILLLIEENGLGKIDLIKIAKILVVVIMPIPPHLKWEESVYPEDVAEEFVEGNGLEEGEMSHVMELDEDTHDVEGVDQPADHTEVEVDEEDGDGFDEEAGSEREESLGVAGSDI